MKRVGPSSFDLSPSETQFAPGSSHSHNARGAAPRRRYSPCYASLLFFRFGSVGLLLSSCGYAPAYGGARPVQQLTVAAAPSLSPESGALASLLNGLRQELSRAGALRAGSGYPRAVVELLRVDERGAGVAVQPGLPSATPLARSSTVGVTARAWVEDSVGGYPYRDTGDVRRVATVATGTTLERDATAHDAALESAGYNAGRAIGRRLLGEVEPAIEPL